MPYDYPRVMVGVDGSVESEYAYKKAVEIAKRNDSELLIVHVVDTRSYQGVENDDGNWPEKNRQEIKATHQDYKAFAENNGAKNARTRIEYGSPKKYLARTLPLEEKISLVVVGATGLNAIERVFVGSVSEYVI